MKNHYRKMRMLALSPRHWKKRVVFWFGALLVGIVASYFALAVDWAQSIFDQHIAPHTYLPLLLTPLGFGLSAWATRRYFPAARGSGIPQVIAARIHRDEASRQRLIGLPLAGAKMVLTILGVLVGASIGREGPSVQVGAAIMLACASYGGLRHQRGVVLAGAAAGVAAAFNTPLAGIVFAIEEMARAFEQRNSSIVLIAIVFAGAAAMSILGNYDYFGYTNAKLSINANWGAVLVVGIVGGLLGSLFARILIDGEPWLRAGFGQWGERRPVFFAIACGLGVAGLGWATHGVTYGSGYAMGHALLHGEMAAEWWQMPAKLLSTALSAISGIPGGIFSPSLSVGSAFGAEIAAWFPGSDAQAVILLGMVAYFAGVTQAPITAFVIVLEITGSATQAVPLIAAAVLAAATARLICPHSLYHALAKRFLTPPSTPGN